MRVVIALGHLPNQTEAGVAARARSYQFAQVLELMQQNEQKEQFFMGDYFGFTATNNRFLVRDCVLKNHG